MDRIMNAVIGITLLLLVGACSSADVSGDESFRKSGDMMFRNEGYGTQNITVNIKGSSDKKTGTSQVTDNDPTNKPAEKIDVGLDEAKEVLLEKTATGVDIAKQVLGKEPVKSTKQPAGEPENAQKKQVESAIEYETKYHHTTTGSSDGGKSLVLCPGQVIKFDKCTSGGVNIPFHGHDTGRVVYWNMSKEPEGDILCEKDGRVYKYRADKTIVYGDC